VPFSRENELCEVLEQQPRDQGPAPGPLLQYSAKRLPVALKARPVVAAAAYILGG
jgi:hypothetical protein